MSEESSESSCEESTEEGSDTSENDSSYSMALYKPISEGEVTDGEISELEEVIAEAEREGRLQKGEIARNPSKVKTTLNKLYALLKEYKQSGHYADLKTYLQKKGYTLRDPTILGVYDDNPHAVARTDTQKTLEGNINLDEAIAAFAREHKLTEEEASYMLITHELIHLAQPDHVLYGAPTPYVAEMDVEETLLHYFTQKRFTTGKDSYAKMATAAYARLLALQQDLRSGEMNYRKKSGAALEKRVA